MRSIPPSVLNAPGRFLAGIAAAMIGASAASAQTTSTINFDTVGNWTQGAAAFTSYSNHSYAQSDWVFQGNRVIRNGTANQDGFPGGIGTYSWRLEDGAGSSLTATYNAPATIIGFGFDVRRWDSSPDPSYTVEYSINGGTNYTNTGTTINNAFLDSSSAFKTFTFNLPSQQIVASGDFKVRITRTSGERIMVDNFQWTYQDGPDETAPTLVSRTPVNGAVNVAPATTLSLTFNEAVKAGTGNVLIYRGATLLDTIAASAGTYDGATATFTPSAPLSGSDVINVIVEATAIEDIAGNDYAGLLTPTDWTFTLDTTPPTPTLFPANGNTDFVASASLTLTYDEAVVLGSGTIEILDASDALVESFNVADSLRITVSGNTLRINPTNPLAVGTSYSVVVPTGAVLDLANNPSSAITNPGGWSFTTRGIPAVVISQYYEGTSSNRYIELRNTTNAPLSLDGFSIAAFSPSETAGNQGWKTGQSVTRITDLTGRTIPANGFFLIAEPAATVPAYAVPDIRPAFPSAVAFSGTASIVLYDASGFAPTDVVDAVSITSTQGTDISFYRQDNLPGFDFDPGSSILDYTGTGQPWDSKTNTEVNSAANTDPWYLQGTIIFANLAITLDPTSVIENTTDPVTATVTRSSGVGALTVTVAANNPAAVQFVGSSTIEFADGVTSAEIEILPVDTPFIEGTRIVTLTASAGVNAAAGSTDLTIEDNAGDTVFPIVINEVDADQTGTDTTEFIELYNNSSESVSLAGATLVFYNGNGDVSYQAINLTGTIPANGFFVVGNSAVLSAQITFTNDILQNGADAVALYYGVAASAFPNGTAATAQASRLIDAIVYDTDDADDTGLLDALTPGGVQVNEGAATTILNNAIARVPDGGTRFNTAVWVAQTPTPGATNVLPEPPADDFAAWIAGFDVGALDGPYDIPMGDGVPNILKHILGLAADVAVTGALVEATNAAPGSITFVHTRIKPADLGSDVISGYEWSTDLATWTPDGDASGGVTVVFGAPVVLDDTNADYDVVSVQATVTQGSASRVFVRLTGSQAVSN
jgi:hypothetical protein